MSKDQAPDRGGVFCFQEPQTADTTIDFIGRFSFKARQLQHKYDVAYYEIVSLWP